MMAPSNKRKTSHSNKSTGKNSKTVQRTKARTKQDYALKQEIKIIVIIALSLFLFVCNFRIIGNLGNAISDCLFGIFGLLNYIVAPFVGFLIIFGELNPGNGIAVRRIVCLSFLFLLLDMVIDLISGISRTISKYDIKSLFLFSYADHTGGGVIAASLNYGLLKIINLVGTILVLAVLIIISLIILTEKSLFRAVKNTKENIKERASEDRQFKEEIYEDRRKEKEERKELLRQSKVDDKVLKSNKKVTGVTFNTDLSKDSTKDKLSDDKNINDDVHEINLNGFEPSTLKYDVSDIPINKTSQRDNVVLEDENDEIIPGFTETVKTPEIVKSKALNTSDNTVDIVKEVSDNASFKTEYEFPPRTLLNKGTKKSGDSEAVIRQTAKKLQDTLAIFGVEATVTDISQGPTVTRFELQPKMGVKVSRIKSLSDDIKLNLAASEIRIEAPIPGKAAIGIEVPNKESQPVFFRDLIDTPEYNDFNSKLAFAVGKDIAGKTIVYGIDSFPHLLIAGATGSGKSVCINTLIMSIIYKASPDDVKLIMIDPKVVELSVYNGIPHLLLPVVTDVKKASATLNYCVNEMQERYKKFAEYGVRDLTGFNKAVQEKGEDAFNKKLPHIVIIVDEVADLMLQERKNVEDSICSLAQLARAAGIHLIIATQRPSVDVITGLIKANMPSRIAFAVSSNVDSRTILDMGGAEELLGKGDMLFFPKGLKKPVRLQGGFVSDKEVSDVVDFLKKNGSPQYDAQIEEKIKTCEKKAESGSNTGSDEAQGLNDSLFADAGFFIIDSNKASIGNLQRKFSVGFNRAARIMDQLADAGVVGPEVGTKPREILMSRESFENYLEEYGG